MATCSWFHVRYIFLNDNFFEKCSSKNTFFNANEKGTVFGDFYLRAKRSPEAVVSKPLDLQKTHGVSFEK